MKYILTTFAILLSTFAIAQKDSAKVATTLQSAAVHYGYGAELTHTAKINVTKDTRYIVLDKLSTQLDINSLQVSCPENVSLLSQQFMVYYPPITTKPKIQKNAETIKRMKDSIKLFTKNIAGINNKIDIEQTILSKTEKMIETTIATSGQKTNLNTDVLKLIDYYNAKVEKNKKAIFDYKEQTAIIQESIDGINERIYKLENETDETDEETEEEKLQKSKAYGRIILQVMVSAAKNAEINLTYFTNNAGWQPLYDLRVDSKTNDLKLIYKASITQNTGISWKNVKLTLNTGAPNFTTEAPLLSTWYLQLYAPQVYKALQGRVAGVQTNTNFNMAMTPEVIGYADEKKEKAKDNLDFTTSSTLDDYVNLKQGILNTSFEIDLPYDIESNGQPHSISVKTANLKANLKNYAVPKLDAEAYLLAEIVDWQNLDLLPGSANIILDDTYIGRSFINPNTTMDTMNLSLGKDKRINIKRTLVKDASKSRSRDNYTTQTFVYEIKLRNNKTKEVNLVLKDQYPLSNISEIETKLIEDGGAKVNEEIGTLTWTYKLAPGETKTVRFEYTVKYPKDKKIQNL